MHTIDPPLTGRVAIVTGAAQGIGLGIARSLAEAGAAVALSDINAERLEAAMTELQAIDADLIGVKADVTDRVAVDALVGTTRSHYGRLDILVNNAGVVIVKPFTDHEEEDWNRVIDTNLKGAFLCTRAVVDAMTKSGGGAIVNLCSISAFGFTTPHVPYTASKAGIVGLTRDLAVELAGARIRVNAIAPGPIETPMFDGLSDAQKAEHAAKVPLGRLGQPHDIGAAVVFLVSDAAGFITGVTLPVAGGGDLKFG